ncbi:MAG: hypothetical protein RL129_1048 [Actinomycetota bacterium]
MEKILNNLKGEWAPGVGVFETMRVEVGQIFAAIKHYERAKIASTKLGFQIAPEHEVFDSSKIVITNEDFKVGRLRWQFSDQGDFSISYSEFIDPRSPANLTIFEPIQNYAMPHKTFPYKNLELLKRAQDLGFDDAIISTESGVILESSISSLLFKLDGDWVTPPLGAGILNGIVRSLVIDAGLATERNVLMNDLDKVSSAVLLSSLRSAQPVGLIAGRSLEVDNEFCAKISALHSIHKGK